MKKILLSYNEFINEKFLAIGLSLLISIPIIAGLLLHLFVKKDKKRIILKYYDTVNEFENDRDFILKDKIYENIQFELNDKLIKWTKEYCQKYNQSYEKIMKLSLNERFWIVMDGLKHDNTIKETLLKHEKKLQNRMKEILPIKNYNKMISLLTDIENKDGYVF